MITMLPLIRLMHTVVQRLSREGSAVQRRVFRRARASATAVAAALLAQALVMLGAVSRRLVQPAAALGAATDWPAIDADGPIAGLVRAARVWCVLTRRRT